MSACVILRASHGQLVFINSISSLQRSSNTFLFSPGVLRAGPLFACAVLMYFSVNQTLCVCICWLLTVYVFGSTDSLALPATLFAQVRNTRLP